MKITLEKDGDLINVIFGTKQEEKLREIGYLAEGEKPAKKPTTRKKVIKKEEKEED